MNNGDETATLVANGACQQLSLSSCHYASFQHFLGFIYAGGYRDAGGEMSHIARRPELLGCEPWEK